jgi:8-oxo-dGTP pyrophosphatase MutT (NUDIX family)
MPRALLIATVQISVTFAHFTHILSPTIACLAHHQVGFPGGRMQRSDGGSEMRTAQREVEEELGLVIGERLSQNQTVQTQLQVRIFHSARRRVGNRPHPNRRQLQKIIAIWS